MPGKRIHSLLLALAAFLGVSACASNESPSETDIQAAIDADAAADARAEVVCRKRRPVGSHIPVMVCKTRGQMDRDREAALDSVGMLRTLTGDLPTPPPQPRPPSN